MTPQHWKEILASFMKTYGLSNQEVSYIIKVSPSTLCHWKRTGVPLSKAFSVGRKLSNYVKEMV